MRRLVSIVIGAAALGAAGAGIVMYWRRHPRVGTTFVNSVVNPALVRRGLAGGRASEIGTLEHIGRTSGTRRLTPVHPEPTPEGFRIVVPLGAASQWARNVLAAGHCRLQLHGVVYDLDEPKMIPAGEVGALPTTVRAVMAGLGFEYLELRTFGSHLGELVPAEGDATESEQPDRVRTPEPDLREELVPAAQ